ncbi:MAG: hypothetical protein ACLU9S_01930 [Oscillospiraceae bacterium]
MPKNVKRRKTIDISHMEISPLYYAGAGRHYPVAVAVSSGCCFYHPVSVGLHAEHGVSFSKRFHGCDRYLDSQNADAG